nr:8318_t:CDS:10 [Entrophospora candida]
MIQTNTEEHPDWFYKQQIKRKARDNLYNNGNNNYANGNVKGENVNNNNIIDYDYDFDDIPTTSDLHKMSINVPEKTILATYKEYYSITRDLLKLIYDKNNLKNSKILELENESTSSSYSPPEPELSVSSSFYSPPEQSTLTSSSINKTLDGKDVFVLMPTGRGKSLCHQLPAMVETGKAKGITIVISPLLSLIIDQVYNLNRHDISTLCLYGEQEANQRQNVFTEFEKYIPSCKIFYLTPEMLNRSTAIKRLYDRQQLARFIIDEAHCVSQRGLCPKDSSNKVLANLVKLIQSHRGRLDVIYCTVKIKCENIAKYLQQSRISTKYYHSGLDKADRINVQNEWQPGKLAGCHCNHCLRNGNRQTQCKVCDSLLATTIPRRMIDGGDGTEMQKQQQLLNLFSMMKSCENNIDCRRQQLLGYFAENFNPAECQQTCNNCRELINHQVVETDYSYVAKRLSNNTKPTKELMIKKISPKLSKTTWRFSATEYEERLTFDIAVGKMN